MNWLKQLFSRQRLYDELDQEISLHLELRIEELTASGMTEREATAAARREFGNVAMVKESAREAWGWRWLEDLFGDLRFGARMLRKNPGFTAVAVLTLALGIGANTAIYSFMESILLRSLPVADPESLVVLNWHSRPPKDGHVMHGLQGMFWPGNKGDMVGGIFPYPAFETLREENPVFSTVFGYFNGHTSNLAVRGQATSASTEYVTGEDFT